MCQRASKKKEAKSENRKNNGKKFKLISGVPLEACSHFIRPRYAMPNNARVLHPVEREWMGAHWLLCGFVIAIYVLFIIFFSTIIGITQIACSPIKSQCLFFGFGLVSVFPHSRSLFFFLNSVHYFF